MKRIMCGLDYVVDDKWNPIKRTLEGAYATAYRIMPDYLKRAGFVPFIADCDDHYRINYGRKA